MKTIIDQEAARELELYADNTREIYERYAMPTIENLRKKYNRGHYDHDKAVKAWKYVAEAAAKMYHKEFCSPGFWYDTFNKATRRAVAESMESYYYDEYIDEEIIPRF